ncbi:MAG: AmmeMemoRadiSam system protein A [Candidatus Nealsonbacteria bacterium]|nr:AmmeMemoRadiSam system protein A [Candidatus Nealsonbacteria bacterium]
MDILEFTKQAVESYVKTGKIISPHKELGEDFLNRKAGAFVTILKNKNLRGCIGTYMPTKKNIAEEIIYSAVAAASEDYRFGPIKKEELPSLSYEVYILDEPEMIKDMKELNPKKFGIVVKAVPLSFPTGIDVAFSGHLRIKSGLLLPDLDGVDTVEQQISIACQKAGINPLKEKITIYKFIAKKYR